MEYRMYITCITNGEILFSGLWVLGYFGSDEEAISDMERWLRDKQRDYDEIKYHITQGGREVKEGTLLKKDLPA